MSGFLLAMSKCMKDQDCFDVVVTQFSKCSQNVLNLKDFFDNNATYPELRFIRSMLVGLNQTLKSMFFTPSQSSHLVAMIERLWVDSEAALSTVFKIDFYANADEP